MPYDLYVVEAGQKAAFDEVGIPVTGTMDELLGKVDIVLDSSPGGVGRKNKELYQAGGRQGRLPGRREERHRRRLLPRLRQLREGRRARTTSS